MLDVSENHPRVRCPMEKKTKLNFSLSLDLKLNPVTFPIGHRTRGGFSETSNMDSAGGVIRNANGSNFRP